MSHAWRTLACLLALTLAPGCGSAASALRRPVATGHVSRGLPRPLPGNPGNVFLKGDAVAVAVPQDGVRWVAENYDGRQVGSGSGRTAELGALPVGWYVVRTIGAEGATASRTTLAVLEPLAAPTPGDSPVCLDVSAAWLLGARPDAEEQVRAASSLAALAGVNWVRDRLSWAETEPERGRLAADTRYDMTARVQAEAGLKVLQVFHDSPPWSNPKDATRFPRDLCDVYDYLRAMAPRWRGQVLAWEPWNEADVPLFGGHTGDEIASYQKAAFLGLRAGNPKAVACQNGLATVEYPALGDNFVENEPWPYFDTFDFHHHLDADDLAAWYDRMAGWSAGRPLWVTEAGFVAPAGPEGSGGDLSWKDQQRQARYVAQCLAASIHEGSEATFFCILPSFAADGIQFGLTYDGDMTPRPGYVALAAAGRLLAGARPLGRVPTPAGHRLRAFAFRARPDGVERTVVVAWAVGEGQPLALPWQSPPLSAFDLLGRPVDFAEAAGGIGADPVYLVYGAGAEAAMGLAEPPTRVAPREGQVCPLVLQALIPRERTRPSASAHTVGADEEFGFQVYAYNFTDRPVRGDLTAEAPGSVRVTPPTTLVQIPPMGRTEVRLSVRGMAGGLPAEGAPVRFTLDGCELGDPLLVLRFAGRD